MWFRFVSLRASGRLVAIITVALARPAHADTIHVPGDFSTIQAAIDAAKDGDEIIVAPGTYVENITLLGKPITLRSESGAEVTTIDGGGVRSVVRCENGESSETIIQGFTLTNGLGEESKNVSWGGGVYILGSSPIVMDCRIVANSALKAGANQPGFGGGIYSDAGGATIVGCLITGNTVGFDGSSKGGGAYIGEGTTLNNCLVSGNLVPSFGKGGGVYCGGGSILSCVVRFNQAANYGVGIGLTFSGGFMADSTVCSNWTQDDIDVDVWGEFQDGGGNVVLESCEADVGACCIDGACITTTEAECLAAGGTYEGNATICQETECTPACVADLDGDGNVGVSDLLILLGNWGPCP